MPVVSVVWVAVFFLCYATTMSFFFLSFVELRFFFVSCRAGCVCAGCGEPELMRE
jgi:hypothetical protein